MVAANLKDRYFINERIPFDQVRLIDEEGTMLGVVSKQEAIQRAREAELDLIMVGQGKDYPICKILDWGKFKYDIEKKMAKSKKNQTKIVVKEIKFSPNTSDHDYSYRKDHIIEFLQKGYHVKATIFYKGRTILHQEKGYDILNKLTADIDEYADIDKEPEMKGRTLSVMLLPKKDIIKKGGKK